MGSTTNKAEPILISIVGVSFGIFFCLICIANFPRGITVADENGKGNSKTGVERTADGSIVYCNGEEGELREEAPSPKHPSSVMEDTEPDLTDLELI